MRLGSASHCDSWIGVTVPVLSPAKRDALSVITISSSIEVEIEMGT